MKKTTILIITLVFFITLFILGCIGFAFNDKSKKSTEPDISTSVESEETTEEVESETTENEVPKSGHADLSIPDAKEYDIFTWPEFGIVTKIPTPTWSDRGVFYGSETSEVTFWAEIGYTTLDNYNEYIEACKEMGYDLNIYEDPGYTFWGENEEGYGVQLIYFPWSRYMSVQVRNSTSTWEHWWGRKLIK